MKLDDAVKLERKCFENRLLVRIKKGMDYSNKDDCLTNFKERAQILKILKVDTSTPHGVAINDIILKLQRTCNLLFPIPRKAINETLWDTVATDGPNYWDLLKEILIDAGILTIPEDSK